MPIFLMLLHYTVAKGCTSQINSTRLIRLFLLVIGWGLGTLKLHSESLLQSIPESILQFILKPITAGLNPVYHSVA